MQGTFMGLWNASNAVVQKAMVLVLQPLLLPAISAPATTLLGAARPKRQCGWRRDLLLQFLDHLDDVDGELFAVEKDISQGSSPSLLLGALYLQTLDTALETHA